MAKQLKLQVVLEALDKASAPIQRISTRIGKSTKQLTAMQKQLKSLERTQDIAKHFMNDSRAVDEFRGKVRQVNSSLASAKSKLQDTESDFISLRGKVGNATQAYNKNKAAVTALNLELAVAKNAKEKNAQAIAEMTKRLKVNRAQLAVERDALTEQKNRLKNVTVTMDAQKDEVTRLSRSQNRLTQERREALLTLKKHHRALRKEGISSKQLTHGQAALQDRITQTTKAVEKQKKALERLNKQQRRREKIKGMTDKGKRFAGRAALIGGAGAYTFGRIAGGFIDTAAEFERFEAVLKTTEGSSEKAKKAMSWVSRFATKTPYDVAQVTDSFVKLRAYGLDPTNGLMQTLGDTSAAMGKPLMQAVEAIADAVTGENERLKEFGIKASTKKDIITYNYTDKNGEQKFVKVNKNNRKAIEKALTDIWNEKFTGAMITQSKTWIGLMSNLSDHWKNFQRAVMNSGALDYLKNKINSVLIRLNEMVANGELQAFAEKVGRWFVNAAEGIWQFGKAVNNTIQWVRDLTAPIGGLGNALKMVLGLYITGKFASFASGLAQIGTKVPVVAGSFKTLGVWIGRLGKLVLGHPILRFVAMVAAGATWIWQNWDWLSGKLSQIWEDIKKTAKDWAESVGNFIGGMWDTIIGKINSAIAKIKEFFGISTDPEVAAKNQAALDKAEQAAKPYKHTWYRAPHMDNNSKFAKAAAAMGGAPEVKTVAPVTNNVSNDNKKTLHQTVQVTQHIKVDSVSAGKRAASAMGNAMAQAAKSSGSALIGDAN